MSILKDGIYFRLDTKKKKFYNKLSDKCVSLLKSITRRQIKKFKNKKLKNKKLIPRQLLQVFWELGFLPGKEMPKEGMRLKPFLNFLTNGDYTDQRNKFKGIWLRDKIYEQEFPVKRREHAKFVGINGKNLLPVSYLRTIPGTIYK